MFSIDVQTCNRRTQICDAELLLTLSHRGRTATPLNEASTITFKPFSSFIFWVFMVFMGGEEREAREVTSRFPDVRLQLVRKRSELWSYMYIFHLGLDRGALSSALPFVGVLSVYYECLPQAKACRSQPTASFVFFSNLRPPLPCPPPVPCGFSLSPRRRYGRKEPRQPPLPQRKSPPRKSLPSSGKAGRRGPGRQCRGLRDSNKTSRVSFSAERVCSVLHVACQAKRG